jgi:ribosomal protein S27E
MDGTFLGVYEKNINNWEELIIKDSDNKKKYENEMHDYMARCVPYLLRHAGFGNDNTNKETIDPIFNTVTTEGVQRKQIYYDYLRDVEQYKGPGPAKERKKIKGGYINHNYKFVDKCKACNSSNTYFEDSSSDTICMDCGVATHTHTEELTYAEEQEHNDNIVTQCGYKKENHLNEWILQFQGRETTNIPKEVIEQLKSEFKKLKIKKINEITREKVRQLLKKLKLTKYYEHSTHITHLLNGLKPPEMSNALEGRLRFMFKEIQDPFKKHCPQERNNFLSYSYVLYKFCELLEEDEYLPFFPLLKSKEKLHQQDVIWKKICKELQWEYIQTN